MVSLKDSVAILSLSNLLMMIYDLPLFTKLKEKESCLNILINKDIFTKLSYVRGKRQLNGARMHHELP